MRTEFHRINNLHSFFTVLLISHKFPVMSQLLDPLLFLNFSLVWWSCAVKLIPCLRGYKLEPSFKDSLSCFRYLFSEWVLKNISHWRSVRMTFQTQPTKRYASFVESIDTSSSTYHLTKAKRSKLKLSFGSTLQRWYASYSIWKPSPSVSTKSTNFDNWRTPAYPWSIWSNNLAEALEKYEPGSSSTSSSTYYITVFRLSFP